MGLARWKNAQMKPATNTTTGMVVMRSIFFSCSSENFVVKKATASAMNAPAPTGASVVNRAKGSSAIMLHHLQGIHNLTVLAASSATA